MPIKRRVAKHREHPITPEAIEAYRAGDWRALHRVLKLGPHQPSPLEAVGHSPWPAGSAGAVYWPLAVDLRAELEAAQCR